MSIKSILVHLHDTKRVGRLLAAAVPMARAHEAHLIALGILPPYVVIPTADGVGASVTIDEHRLAYRHDLDAMKAKVSELGRGEALSFEWREADAGFGTTARTLIEHGRTCDLVVISQRDADWGKSSLFEDPERIAIECGRPVLLIPNKGEVKSPPKRVLFAWNGSRESARSAFDAATLLTPGADVTVAWFDPPPGVAGAAVGADLCTALARHGLSCEATEVRTTDGDIGAAIRREASARGAELIVMGAYGHSRLREFVLGGASRDVFANMDRPVLMSH